MTGFKLYEAHAQKMKWSLNLNGILYSGHHVKNIVTFQLWQDSRDTISQNQIEHGEWYKIKRQARLSSFSIIY